MNKEKSIHLVERVSEDVQHPPDSANTPNASVRQGGVVIRGIHFQPVPNQRLFSVGAAAKYLGISDDTLRKYADLGQIPVFRFINGNRAFKLEDLNRLIDDLPLWNDPGSDTARAGRDREVS